MISAIQFYTALRKYSIYKQHVRDCITILLSVTLIVARKRKADGRQFNERWGKSEYMFVLNGFRLVSLLCNEAVAKKKEFNLQRHFDTKHGAKYANLSYEEKQQKVKG